MRILALGGTGDIGRHVVRTLLGFGSVERVTVAGLATPEAYRFVDSLGARAEFRAVDATNTDALEAVIRDCDIVVNTAGPFFSLGERVFAAALACRRPYLDVADDVEPTRILLSMNDLAKRKGVCAVVGLGASPGLTNLLAKMAASQLEQVVSLDTVWNLAVAETIDDGFSRDPTMPSAAVVHWVHCCSTAATVFEEGEWRETPSVQSSRLDLGNGEALTVWSVAHPEPVTLPRRYASLRFSRNFMTGSSETFARLRGILSSLAAGDIDAQSAARQFSGVRPSHWSPFTEASEAGSYGKTPLLLAIARGFRDGRETGVVARLNRVPAGGLGTITGIPLALGARLVGERKVEMSGAHAPEDLLDAHQFFALFEPFCTLPENAAGPLVSISSWEI